MNGYLRKAQHDENNLNIEVTVEVISDFKVKKASVFNGFKRQTTKSTASRLPAARRSSASAKINRNVPKAAEKQLCVQRFAIKTGQICRTGIPFIWHPCFYAILYSKEQRGALIDGLEERHS